MENEFQPVELEDFQGISKEVEDLLAPTSPEIEAEEGEQVDTASEPSSVPATKDANGGTASFV